MNRIQKKCMFVSVGVHVLLAIMLILGPAFLTSRSHDEAPPLLNFIPAETVDAALSGGGDNTVKAPPALGTDPQPPVVPTPTTPVVPQVQVPQPPIVEPTPPRKPEKAPTPVAKESPRVDDTPKADPAPTAKPAPRKPHEITPDLTLKTTSGAEAKAKREAQAKAAAAAAAAEQKRIASAFKSATTGIRGGVAGSTEIKLAGPGGGGVPYGNFLSAVEKIYYDAWTPPPGAPESDVSVSITIARDGTIISTRITDGSGNAALDSSVQKALDRVRAVPPLPQSEIRDSRTVTISFNPDNK